MTAAEPRDSSAPGVDAGPEGYEPPEVVQVLREDDLRREVHYAGAVGSGPPG